MKHVALVLLALVLASCQPVPPTAEADSVETLAALVVAFATL